MSTLSPSKITEELLSKKCQGDLELKNSTEYNKTLKCSFCHKNIHENIKRFAYIATLIPFNQSESFASYELKGVISSLQKENNSAPCKNLLRYTTWDEFPGLKENVSIAESGYSVLTLMDSFVSPLKCYMFQGETYMCETQNLFTSENDADKSRAFFLEIINEDFLKNFESHAFFSFIFERPEYVRYIFAFKGIFFAVTICFFYFVKQKLSYLRMQDWLKVHKCFFFILLGQVIYNDPLGIINNLWIQNETIDIVSEILEILFYNFLMMLWLGLLESALKESNRRKIYIFEWIKYIIPFIIFALSGTLKVLLWMKQTTNPLQNPLAENALYVNLKIALFSSLGFYTCYFFILASQHTYLVIRKEEGITDYKYLCIFSEIIFIMFLICSIITLNVPRNYSAFYNISFLALINLYLFGVYILYSPADYTEVTGKSMEMHEIEQTSSSLVDTTHEDAKKKVWEQINKSTEEEHQEHHKDEEDDDKYLEV